MRDIDLHPPADLEFYCLFRFLQSHLIAAFTRPDGAILSCTEKYQMLFGADARFDELVHPDDLYQEGDLKQQLLTGQIKQFRTEKRLVNHLGSGERWFEVETFLLQPGATEHDSILAIVLTDITENRKIYDALLWDKRRWSDLVNHSWLLFFQCDDAANLFYFTPRVANLLGLQPDEWIGHSITEMIHPEDLNEFEIFFNKSLQGDSSSSVICRFKTQEAVWMEFKLKAQINHTEKGVILHAQDLSAQFALSGQVQFYRSQYKALLTDLSQMLSI